jgi:hypothetical protein
MVLARHPRIHHRGPTELVPCILRGHCHQCTSSSVLSGPGKEPICISSPDSGSLLRPDLVRIMARGGVGHLSYPAAWNHHGDFLWTLHDCPGAEIYALE